MNTTPNENLENENVATAEPEEITETEVVTEEVTEEAAVEDAVVEEIAEEVSEEAAVELEAPIADADNESCGCKKKNFAFAGLLALVLVCAALWAAYSGIFADKYAEIYDTSNMSAVYVVDDNVKAHKSNGKVYDISANINAAALSGQSTKDVVNNTMLRSPDGSAVFYYENYDVTTYTGDLYVRYNDGKAQAIDTGVSAGLMTSADGRVLVYAKITETEEGTSAIALHVYKKNSKPKLLTANYTPSVSPMMSYSAKYLAYAAPDAETGTNALYVTKVSGIGATPVKVADNVTSLYSVNDRGYAFFTQSIQREDGTSVNALCYAAPKKEVTVVAEKASVREDCFGQLTNRFAYYTHTDDDTAQFYISKVGKAPELLFEDSDFYLNPDVENNKHIFITIDSENPDMLHIQRANGKKVTMVAENTSANGLNTVLNSRDYNKITYMRNFNEETYSGEFFMSKTVLGHKTEIKIADNVSLAIGTPDLDYVAYFTDLDLNTGYGKLHIFDGKKSTLVAENVPYYTVSFSGDDKMLFYLTDCSEDRTSATLNMTKTAKPQKSVVIDTEISTVNTYEFLYTTRTNGSVYYYKNYDATTGRGDLYFAKKGKNPKLVESSISGLILE